MDLHTWLDKEKGRSSWLAEQLGLTKAAVSLWRSGGVPLAYMARIAFLTEGAVTIEEMVLHAAQRRAGNSAERKADKERRAAA